MNGWQIRGSGRAGARTLPMMRRGGFALPRDLNPTRATY
jgi:hypothetical protein